MNLTTVLAVMLVTQTVGLTVFAAFEVETPAWRRLLKWAIVNGTTLGLYPLIGGWCLLVYCAAFGTGLVFHLWVCRKEGFHPINATPRRAYYVYRGWVWPDQDEAIRDGLDRN